MGYCKELVDNPTCQRRFHIAYDDQADPQKNVEVQCPFCQVTLFAAKNHPPVKLLRQENLVKTTKLSEKVFYECRFEDEFSKTNYSHSNEKSSFRLYE